MKQLVLGMAVFCGFVGESARAEHQWDRHAHPGVGRHWPGDASWTRERDTLVLPRAGGRFGRGRRIEAVAYPAGPHLITGGPHPALVPPSPQPQWPVPGVGLPHEGLGALGYYRPGDFVQGAVPLYPRVKYKDRDEAAPGGMTVVVAVAAPGRCKDVCATAGPPCVFVPICVPQCPLRDIDVDDGGSKIKFDYGEYTVEIESEDGQVVVDYDD